ncbi:hypothetical protein BDP81DRAFT_89443 [Colletotrichum phormii]|uniref:Uncharacterized protein n=1 Tax=Colletotrichum phormii TaxID=359342 RepID=A0AAJ0EMV1_9PEZI|nr:uncharacterized protein BDP81DRAFT_89443 [Colletotrichum phormii]KAK1654828.1 hypothetical protein BDP81DRAFT_89443 [Colletotrichum phormii]
MSTQLDIIRQGTKYFTERWTQSRDSVRPPEHAIGQLSAMATGFPAETPSDPDLYSNPTRRLPHPHGPSQTDRPTPVGACNPGFLEALLWSLACLTRLPYQRFNAFLALSEAAHHPCYRDKDVKRGTRGKLKPPAFDILRMPTGISMFDGLPTSWVSLITCNSNRTADQMQTFNLLSDN